MNAGDATEPKPGNSSPFWPGAIPYAEAALQKIGAAVKAALAD